MLTHSQPEKNLEFQKKLRFGKILKLIRTSMFFLGLYVREAAKKIYLTPFPPRIFLILEKNYHNFYRFQNNF